MKFGKQLRGIVDCSYPEWQPNFMSYKELKKRIVSRDNKSESSARDDEKPNNANSSSSTPCEGGGKLSDSAEFFTFLQSEIEKVNDFFLEKQEDYVIKHEQLSMRVSELMNQKPVTRIEINQLRQQLIDFHAQLVILENYSTVNYTGFRKILKKHDKKTGLNVRTVALNKVTTTPFFLSDVARRLLLSTEQQISQLDQIRKFRRISSGTDLPAQPSAFTTTNPALQQMTTAPLEPIQASQILPTSTNLALSSTQPTNKENEMEHEKERSDEIAQTHRVPDTPIGTRAPLLRLYRDCVEYSRISKSSGGTVPPPQSLIDNVDRLDANALGLSEEFMNSVTEPTNFCLAEDEALSVGYFVVPGGTKLQMFDFEIPGSAVVRLVQGAAVLRVFGGSKSVRNESTELPRLAILREGKVVGPWPAVTACASANYSEWNTIDSCAIVYVQFPSVCNVRLQRYEIVRDGDTNEFVATPKDELANSKFLKVWV